MLFLYAIKVLVDEPHGVLVREVKLGWRRCIQIERGPELS